LLTNLEGLKPAIAAFKCRSRIEATFKDCKTGGYNLEKSHANNERLKSLTLVIAIAYSCAVLQWQKLNPMGIKKYTRRLNKCKSLHRNFSNFWIGLYGQSWGVGMEVCQEIVAKLMRIRRNTTSPKLCNNNTTRLRTIV
jgi:hypothetical protein